jgi:hypothetical protein
MVMKLVAKAGLRPAFDFLHVLHFAYRYLC